MVVSNKKNSLYRYRIVTATQQLSKDLGEENTKQVSMIKMFTEAKNDTISDYIKLMHTNIKAVDVKDKDIEVSKLLLKEVKHTDVPNFCGANLKVTYNVKNVLKEIKAEFLNKETDQEQIKKTLNDIKQDMLKEMHSMYKTCERHLKHALETANTKNNEIKSAEQNKIIEHLNKIKIELEGNIKGMLETRLKLNLDSLNEFMNKVSSQIIDVLKALVTLKNEPIEALVEVVTKHTEYLVAFKEAQGEITQDVKAIDSKLEEQNAIFKTLTTNNTKLGTEIIKLSRDKDVLRNKLNDQEKELQKSAQEVSGKTQKIYNLTKVLNTLRNSAMSANDEKLDKTVEMKEKQLLAKQQELAISQRKYTASLEEKSRISAELIKTIKELSKTNEALSETRKNLQKAQGKIAGLKGDEQLLLIEMENLQQKNNSLSVETKDLKIYSVKQHVLTHLYRSRLEAIKKIHHNFDKNKKKLDSTNETIKLMARACKSVKAARGKEIVLFIGKTGAGKSTTINYLMGAKLCKKRKKDIPGFDPRAREKVVTFKDGSNRYADIGHDVAEAKTLFSKVIDQHPPGNKSFYLCDTPGFDDSHIKEEERICAEMGYEVAIKSVKRVKAIVVVVPHTAITTSGRSKGFKEVVNIISKLLKDPSVVRASIFFAFTKLQDSDTEVEDIVFQIEQIEKHFVARVKDYHDHFDYDDFVCGNDYDFAYVNELSENIKLLRIIRSNPNNILLINPIGHEKDRNEIIDKFQKVRSSIAIDQFKFRTSGSRAKLRKMMIELASKGVRFIGDISESSAKTKSVKKDISLNVLDIELAKRNLADYIQGGSKGTAETLFKPILKRNKSKTDKVIRTMTQLKQARKGVRAKLEHEEKDETIVKNYWSEEFVPKLWSDNHTFKYDDIPFVKVTKTYDGGGIDRVFTNEYKTRTCYTVDFYDISFRATVASGGLRIAALAIAGGTTATISAPIVLLSMVAPSVLSLGSAVVEKLTGKTLINSKNYMVVSGSGFGIFENKLVQKLAGYSTFYSKARVVVDVYKRCLIDAIELMNEYKSKLKKIDNKMTIQEEEKSILEEECKSIKRDYNSALNNNKTMKQAYIKCSEKVIEKLINDIYLLNKESDAASIMFNESQKSFIKNKDLFDMLQHIDSVLGIDSKYITMFLDMYNNNNFHLQNEEIKEDKNQSSVGIQYTVGTQYNSALSWLNNKNSSSYTKGLQWEEQLNLAIKKSLKSSESKERTTALINQAKEYGFTCKDMKHDGNCFFGAVAHQLNRISYGGRSDYDADIVRAICMNHIDNNQHLYAKSIEGSCDKFIKKMSRNGEWTNNVVICACSRALGVNVMIVRSDSSDPTIIKRGNWKNISTIYLGYEVGIHYQSLISKMNNSYGNGSLTMYLESFKDIDSYKNINPTKSDKTGKEFVI